MDLSTFMISTTFGRICMFYWQIFFGGIKSQHTNKSGHFWQCKYYFNEKDSNIEFLNLSVHPRGNNFLYATLLLMAYFSSIFPALKHLCFKELFYRDRLLFDRWSDDVSMKALLLEIPFCFQLRESWYKIPWLHSKSDFTLSTSYSLFFLLALDKIKTQAGGTVFSLRFFPMDVIY